MSEVQMLWYAHAIGEEKSEKYKDRLALTEYLASFWNADAVEKIRAQRQMSEDERFATDEQFEDLMLNREYLDIDKEIREITESQKNTNLQSKDEERYKTITPPKDMSGLFNIIKK